MHTALLQVTYLRDEQYYTIAVSIPQRQATWAVSLPLPDSPAVTRAFCEAPSTSECVLADNPPCEAGSYSYGSESPAAASLPAPSQPPQCLSGPILEINDERNAPL